MTSSFVPDARLRAIDTCQLPASTLRQLTATEAQDQGLSTTTRACASTGLGVWQILGDHTGVILPRLTANRANSDN
jgi:hypothetical protein